MTNKQEHLAERAAALLLAGQRAPIPSAQADVPRRNASLPLQSDPRTGPVCAAPVASVSRPSTPGRAERRRAARLHRSRLALHRAGAIAARCKPAAMAWSRRGIKLAVAVVPWAYLTTVVWAQAAGGGGAGTGTAVNTAVSDVGGLRSLLERLQPNQPATVNEKAWTFDGAINLQAGAISQTDNTGRDNWSFVGIVQPEFNLAGDTRRLTVRLYYSPVLTTYSNGGGTQISHYMNGDATVAIVPDWFYFDLRAYASELPRYGGYYYGNYGYGNVTTGSNLITPLLTSNNSGVQSATVSATPYLIHTFDGWGTARLGYSLTRTWLGDDNNASSTLPGYGTTGNLTTNRVFGSFTSGENFYRFGNEISVAADQYGGGNSIYHGAHDFAAIDTASYAIYRWLSALASVGYEQIKYGGADGFNGDFFDWSVGVRVVPNADSQLTLQYGRKEGEYTWLFNGYYSPTPRLNFYGSYDSTITTYLQRLQTSLQTTVVGPSGVLVNQTSGSPVSVVSPFGIYNGVSRVKTLNIGASYIINREAFSASVTREEDTTLTPSQSTTGTVISAGVTGTGTAGSISWQHDLNPDTALTSTFSYGVSDNGAFVGSPGSSTNFWSLTSQLSHRFTPTLTGSASFSHAEQFGASGSAANLLNTSQNLILVGLRKAF